ncbi:MAG TPA: VWA domain-containing protein, partial [Planctomycetota bacterium]|nr:VWA domain-containing protein [Planctomycetota bacterium]
MTEFLHADRIHLLWAALALLLLIIGLERRGSGQLSRFIQPAMADRLAIRPSAGRRRWRVAAVGAALALGVVALMRPQSRAASEAVESRDASAEVMVLLDVSKSMLAEDAAPNRLERAKAEVRDLVRALPGHRVGLIAFAGRASVLCPLTPDAGFFRLVLETANPGSVTRGGTRIGDAIRKALDGFTPGPGAKAIVLVTDGEDHDSYPVEAAKAAKDQGVRIVSIGFGDEKGAEIPITDPKTGERAPLKDRTGQVVRSRLDGAALREIALTTEG